MPASAAPVESEFASLIRGPGEQMPVADPDAGVRHRESTAAASVPAEPDAVRPDVPPVPAVPRLQPVPLPDPPLVAAVRAYLDGHSEQAVEHLKPLDKANQELMLQLIPVVVRASQVDLVRAGPTELGMMAAPLEAAADTLSARAPLGLERAYFCRSVKDFGRYDPLPDRHPFRPWAAAELYVEVKNAPSEPVTASPGEGDGYVAKLTWTLQVRDATGATVELPGPDRRPVPIQSGVKRDFTRSPVRDYFLLFRFPVPGKAGSYAVSIEVRDPATGRAVSRTIPLRVQ